MIVLHKGSWESPNKAAAAHTCCVLVGFLVSFQREFGAIVQKEMWAWKEEFTGWAGSFRLAAGWPTTVPRGTTHTRIWPEPARRTAPGNPAPGELSSNDAGVSDEDDVARLSRDIFLCFHRWFCFAVVECPDPKVLEFGYVSPPQERYFVDNETTYACVSGFRLRGSSTRVCLANGKWSGSTPICSRDSRPRQQPSFFPFFGVGWFLTDSFSVCYQQQVTVLIPVSQLGPWKLGMCLKLVQWWSTAATTTWCWWGPGKGSVCQAVSGRALNQHVTVRVSDASKHSSIPFKTENLCSPPSQLFVCSCLSQAHLRLTLGGFTDIWQRNQTSPHWSRASRWVLESISRAPLYFFLHSSFLKVL